MRERETHQKNIKNDTKNHPTIDEKSIQISCSKKLCKKHRKTAKVEPKRRPKGVRMSPKDEKTSMHKLHRKKKRQKKETNSAAVARMIKKRVWEFHYVHLPMNVILGTQAHKLKLKVPASVLHDTPTKTLGVPQGTVRIYIYGLPPLPPTSDFVFLLLQSCYNVYRVLGV